MVISCFCGRSAYDHHGELFGVLGVPCFFSSCESVRHYSRWLIVPYLRNCDKWIETETYLSYGDSIDRHAVHYLV
jgi:hypothetical protein